MANLTITVDDAILERARMRALEQGTSVNAILAEYLETWSGIRNDPSQTLEAIFEVADREHAGRERVRTRRDRGWTREELYDERIGRRGPREDVR